MIRMKVKTASLVAAALAMFSSRSEALQPQGVYTVECRDAAGNLRWIDRIENLVTDTGVAKLLDEALAGSAYTAAWYMGLISATGYTAVANGDTAASHAGWTESAAYSQATRPAVAFAAAAARAKATSAGSVFTMNAGGTIKGAFIISNNTKSGTTGVLLSAGTFSGGDRVVQNGDSLTCTYSLTLT